MYREIKIPCRRWELGPEGFSCVDDVVIMWQWVPDETPGKDAITVVKMPPASAKPREKEIL